MLSSLDRFVSEFCFGTLFYSSHFPIDSIFPGKYSSFIQERFDTMEKVWFQKLSNSVWKGHFNFIWKLYLHIDFNIQYSKLSDLMLILVNVEWEWIAVTTYAIYFKILLILCLLRKHQLCLGRNQRHTWIFLIFSLLKAINEDAAFRFCFLKYIDSIQAHFSWIATYFNLSVLNN